MHWIDWTIIAIYLVWIVWDGLRLTKRSHELEGYFLASRSLPWWAVGLSVMATQLSAITLVGTTGQGYGDGYQYPYDFPNAVVDQSYFPPGLEGTTFYYPKEIGFEREIRKRMEWIAARRRELRRKPPPPATSDGGNR